MVGIFGVRVLSNSILNLLQQILWNERYLVVNVAQAYGLLSISHYVGLQFDPMATSM